MPPPARPSRRFTMLDALILVVMTAAALGIHRYVGTDIWERWERQLKRQVQDGMPPRYLWTTRTGWCEVMIAPLALLAAPTLLSLNLVPPRPPRRRWTTQVGALACMAAMVAFTFHLTAVGTDSWTRYGKYEDPFHFGLVEWLEFPLWDAGIAVAAVWAIMALGGRLRSEPTWIDRSGRLLGFYLLACVVVAWLSDVY